MRLIKLLALLLLVIGGLNWGLYGLFQYDLIQAVLGSMPGLAKLVYALVGLSGLYGISFFFCKHTYSSCCCKKDK
jgi:hypothetical protein